MEGILPIRIHVGTQNTHGWQHNHYRADIRIHQIRILWNRQSLPGMASLLNCLAFLRHRVGFGPVCADHDHDICRGSRVKNQLELVGAVEFHQRH